MRTAKSLIRLDAQADLSLRWTHSHFISFVMSRLTYIPVTTNVKKFSKSENYEAMVDKLTLTVTTLLPSLTACQRVGPQA